jgi:DNA end-binding protein Ku
MARMLVESMAGDFEPEGHVDDYKEAVEALVASKIEGGDVTESPDAVDEDADSGEVVDLLAALQRSVERAKQGRGGGAAATDEDEDEDGETDDTDEPPARKTGSARTTTAKKAAPRKSAAKKTASTRKAASKKAG